LDSFLKTEFQRQNPDQPADNQRLLTVPKTKRNSIPEGRSVRVIFRGRDFEAPSYISAVSEIINELATADATFLPRLGEIRLRTKRYVAKEREDLFSGRPDLAQEYARPIAEGWWLGTDFNRAELEKMVRIACSLSGLEFGVDLVIRPAKAPMKIDRRRAFAFVGISQDSRNDVARNHDEYFVQTLENTNAKA
jgi:hypothetical protein